MRHTREFLGKNTAMSRGASARVSRQPNATLKVPKRKKKQQQHDYRTSGNTFAAELKMYNNKMLLTFSLFRFWWKLVETVLP